MNYTNADFKPDDLFIYHGGVCVVRGVYKYGLSYIFDDMYSDFLSFAHAGYLKKLSEEEKLLYHLSR